MFCVSFASSRSRRLPLQLCHRVDCLEEKHFLASLHPLKTSEPFPHVSLHKKKKKQVENYPHLTSHQNSLLNIPNKRTCTKHRIRYGRAWELIRIFS